MKQGGFTTVEAAGRRESKVTTEHIWETFDSLFKTVHRQGRRVEELEARIVDLERRLAERNAQATQAPKSVPAVEELPVERAA